MSKETPEETGPEFSNELNIAGQIVAPGETTSIRIPVGRLPSDTRIYVHLNVFNSLRPGPVMLVLGGVHGDEINGIEIVRRTIEQKYYERLKCGAVIAIPLLNVYGFINFSREVPDGKDVNRSFPGSTTGSVASRVARLLTKNVIPSVDFIIDFHTGGASRYNYPQLRCTKGDAQSLNLARSFNPPFIVYKPVISKSLRRFARSKNIPIIVFEGGEALRLDGFSINKALRGLERVMESKGMIDGPISAPQRTVIIKSAIWLRASSAGIFTWHKSSGARVKKGEPIGIITDPNGTKRSAVLANRAGYIIGHNNASVVNQGDALFNIGYAYEEVPSDELV